MALPGNFDMNNIGLLSRMSSNQQQPGMTGFVAGGPSPAEVDAMFNTQMPQINNIVGDHVFYPNDGGGFMSDLRKGLQNQMPQTGAGQLPPGIDPRAVAADPKGYANFAQQQQAYQASNPISYSGGGLDGLDNAAMAAGLGGLLGGVPLNNLAAGTLGYMAGNLGIEQARQLPSQLGQAAADITNQVGSLGEFRPFTVRQGNQQVGSFGSQGLDLAQSQQSTDLMNQAQGMIGGLGQGLPDTSRLTQSAFGRAQNALGANTGAFASNQGQALSREGAAQAIRQSPTGLEGLQGQFTNLGMQAPQGASQGLLGLTGQAQGLASQQLGQQAPDVTGAFSGITAPEFSQASSGVANQYLQAGSDSLGQATPTAGSVYEQIRAMQSPEEERQRSALEERLAAQGRLGVRTNQYGGTPEQLAMEKAQAEARNSASLQAMTTADQLASSQQSRAQQLTQMGLSADQIANQLQSEGFGQQMNLAQAQVGAQQAQQDINTAQQARAQQLASLGLSGEQLASQLESEGLGRISSAAGLAGNLAGTGANIQNQRQQLGQGLLGLGLNAQQLGGTLGSQDISNAMNLTNMGAATAGLGSQLQAQDISNIANTMSAAGIPLQQQLSMLSPGLALGGMLQSPAQLQAQTMANLGQQAMSGIPSAINAEALLRQAQMESIMSGLGVTGGKGNYAMTNPIGDTVNNAVNNGLGWLGETAGNLFNRYVLGNASSSDFNNYGSGDAGVDARVDDDYEEFLRRLGGGI